MKRAWCSGGIAGGKWGITAFGEAFFLSITEESLDEERFSVARS